MELTGFYTQKGLALSAKLLTGTALTVTKVTAGSGETAVSASALAAEAQTLAVNTPVRSGGTVTIPATLVAAQSSSDYFLTELGVYARDPSEGEILYKVYRLSTPTNIDSNSSAVLRFYLSETVSDDLNVSVTCSPAGLLVEADLEPVYRAISQKPTALQVSTTLHVAKTGSDTTGDGSAAKPFLTIQKAVDSLPELLMARTTIVVHEGTYAEQVTINSFCGNEILALQGNEGETVNIQSIHAMQCCTAAGLRLSNFHLTGTSEDRYNYSLYVHECNLVFVDNVVCENAVSEANYGALTFFYTGLVRVTNCTVSNKPVAVDVGAATVYLSNTVTGENNTVGLRCGSGWAVSGGFVQKGGASMDGEEQTGYGGQIW